MTEKSKARESAAAALVEILGHVGILRVIYVDDELFVGRLETLVALVDANSDRIPPQVQKDGGFDLKQPEERWKKQLETTWKSLDEPKRKRFQRQIRHSIATGDEEDHALFGDSFRNLLGEITTLLIAPDEWIDQKDSLLAEVDQGVPTLVLFDLDLSKAEGFTQDSGYMLASSAIATNRDGLYCGVVSNRYGPGEERAFAREHVSPKDRERIVFLSKKTLHEAPLEFAAGVKRVWLADKIALLHDHVATIIKAAHKDAVTAVNGIDTFDLVYAVIHRSFQEGQWELETYRRIYEATLERSFRKLDAKNTDIVGVVRDLRASVQIARQVPVGPGIDLLELESLERYESLEDLSESRLSISLGDIFEVNSGPTTQTWILLGHPCDLAVRSETGHRALTNATLAQVTATAPDQNSRESSFELKFYHVNGAKAESRWVDLKQCISVPLLVLDLCAFSTDGTATWVLGAPPSPVLRPSGEAHVQAIGVSLLELAERFSAEPSRAKNGVDAPDGVAVGGQSIVKLEAVANSSQYIPGRYDPTNMTVTFACSRIRRLKEPFSMALLIRHGQFLSRLAFEMELGK